MPERETAGQLLATQVASLILKRNPEERRTLAMGLGIQSKNLESDEFMELVDLCLKVL